MLATFPRRPPQTQRKLQKQRLKSTSGCFLGISFISFIKWSLKYRITFNIIFVLLFFCSKIYFFLRWLTLLKNYFLLAFSTTFAVLSLNLNWMVTTLRCRHYLQIKNGSKKQRWTHFRFCKQLFFVHDRADPLKWQRDKVGWKFSRKVSDFSNNLNNSPPKSTPDNVSLCLLPVFIPNKLDVIKYPRRRHEKRKTKNFFPSSPPYLALHRFWAFLLACFFPCHHWIMD